MTGPISTPRYSAEDFETASIRSAAPSYVSEVPSYHSTATCAEATPAYSTISPRAAPLTADAGSSHVQGSSSGRRVIGLPPVPTALPQSTTSLHSFRIPTWSTANAPAARLYRKVAERRVIDGRFQAAEWPPRRPVVSVQEQAIDRQNESSSTIVPRPLEDPYLVGELAAAEARRERLARESGDDVLQREDRQWDWFLAHMRDVDERERNWNNYRRTSDLSHRKTLLRRIGGRH